MASATTALLILSFFAGAACGQLCPTFYSRTCPNVHGLVRSSIAQAVNREPRMGASILRLFFHDCFVNGCDASILLGDTATFTGEQNAGPNKNSVRGFEVIDAIKTRVEASCQATVSCADILALAARDSVVVLGGPSRTVQLGRRDATTASQSAANSQIPKPSDDLSTLISLFAAKGLNARDMTALSGGHTIGQAQCKNFRSHIYTMPTSTYNSRHCANRTALPRAATASSPRSTSSLQPGSATTTTRTWWPRRGSFTRTRSSSTMGRRIRWFSSTASMVWLSPAILLRRW